MGPRRGGNRRVRIRTYSIAFSLPMAAIALGVALSLKLQAEADTRSAAGADAAESALQGASELGTDLASAREAASGLAANPSIGILLAHPEACTLSFSQTGAFTTGHIDLVEASGIVGCTSRGAAAAGQATYAGASWLAQASTGTAVVAPVVDGATGGPAAVVAAPIKGGGVVAIILDLAPVGPALADRYGGRRHAEMLVLTGNTILARSLTPAAWIGKSEAGTAFAATAMERPGVDGTVRFYGGHAVAGSDWQVVAGVDRDAALAPVVALEERQTALIFGGLLVGLLAYFSLYRLVVRPIGRLSEAVTAGAASLTPVPVDATGPREIWSLGNAVNTLIASVNRELEERQEAERNYRLIFDTSPLPKLIVDNESGLVVEANAAAQARYGHPRERLVGMAVEDLLVSDQPPLFDEAANGRPFHHRAADGTAFEARVISHEVLFGGRPAHFVMVQEVTEVERLERQLRQSQRLESLGELAGGVAHDFNNLLAVILNYSSFVRTELAKAGPELRPVLDDVQQIEAAAERGTRLTRQLLAFARREVSQPEILSVNDVVVDLEPLLRRTLGEHIRLATSLAPGAWPIRFDPSQLEQVLVNLAVNARDAMKAGGSLTIDTANMDVDDVYTTGRPDLAVGRYVRLRVSDSGEGMDEETLRRAFEPFFTTKPKGEGSGLGLATVYGIVSQAGGRARIYSEPGHGTTFTALLPAVDVALPPKVAPAEERHGGEETVLVVEDEPALLEVACRILSANGYRVLRAGGGAEALALVGSGSTPIHLLLTDVIMPGMLGEEVARRVRQVLPEVRVLYVSGYAQPVLGPDGTLPTGFQLLEKPFTEAQLLRRVREVLDGRGEADG